MDATREIDKVFEVIDLDFEVDPAPLLQPPFGIVVLPSPRLDHVDGGWLEIFRWKQECVSVNLAQLSKRLWDADALPRHHVALDNPKRRASHRTMPTFASAAELERCYRAEGVTTWGCYDFWFRRERIFQAKRNLATGEHLPRWVGAEECHRNESGEWTFAGQYSAFAAVNIAAHLMGFRGTVMVLANSEVGGYCELCLETTSHWNALMRKTLNQKRIASADNIQWGYLRRQMKEISDMELVHVGDSPTNTVTKISEELALEVINGEEEEGREVVHESA